MGISGFWILVKKIDAVSEKLNTLNEVSEKLDKIGPLTAKVDSLQDGIYTQLSELQRLVTHLQLSTKKDSELCRQLVHQIQNEIKKDDRAATTTTSGNLSVYILAAAVLTICLLPKGTCKSVVNGTKHHVEGLASTLAKKICKKSAVITDKLRQWTECLKQWAEPDEKSETECLGKKEEPDKQSEKECLEKYEKAGEQSEIECLEKYEKDRKQRDIECLGKYEKPDEQSETLSVLKNLAPNEASKSKLEQEYSDRLFDIVMEEGRDFDEDFLAKVFDHLNGNHIAARGFIFKTSNMRKKWLHRYAWGERNSRQ